MFISAYDTTFGRNIPTADLATRIQAEALLSGSLASSFFYVPLNKRVITPDYVMTVNDNARDIPQFAHPITLSWNSKNPQGKLVVVDVRPFTRKTPEGDLIITAKDDFDLLCLRAGLQVFATEHHMYELQQLGTFPMTVYIRWISEAISRKLGLQPADQVRLTIIVGALYTSLFRDAGDRSAFSAYSEKEKINIATSIAKSTMISPQTVFEVLDSIPAVYDLQTFCDTVATHGGSIRFERFNLGLLQQILGGSWMGLNSRELVAVALEHPPTFFSMVYSALKSRGYRKAHLSLVVENNNKNNVGSNWARSLLELPGVLPTYSPRT
jgi:hypothetical protein